jgi:uroporphyrinogen decarboxylase
LACQITLQPIDRYAGLLDASIIFSDILVIPKAMGMTIQMIEAKGPTFDEPLVTPEDIKKLKKEVDVRKELGYVMDAINLTRRELKGRVPLLGFIGAPWTLLAYMVEGGGSKTFTKAKSWLYKYPQETKDLLQRITDIAIEFLSEQIIAGAQVFSISRVFVDGRWCKSLILGLGNCRLRISLLSLYHISYRFPQSCTRSWKVKDIILRIQGFRRWCSPREHGMH